MMMHTTRSRAILNALYTTRMSRNKIRIYIQLINEGIPLDLYVLYEDKGDLLCLVDNLWDENVLELEYIDPDYLDGKQMFYKIYRKKERPYLKQKIKELNRIKKH